MVTAKEHMAMATVLALVGAAFGAALGGATIGFPAALASTVIGGLGGAIIGSFM